MAFWNKKKTLPYIPVQPQEQSAAFAGKQYEINSSARKDDHNDAWDYHTTSRIGRIFKDTILRLLFSNFIWYGLEEIEAQTIERQLIMTGQVGAVRTMFSIDNQQPEGVYFGRIAPAGDWFDFYGMPFAATVTGYNGIELLGLTQNDWCICFDTTAITTLSPMFTSAYTYVERLAQELDYAYQALQVAVATHKQGLIFHVRDLQEEKILKSVLRKIDANNPFIIKRGGDDISGQQPVMFAPASAQAVTIYYDNFQNAWSMVMDLLGLEHSASQKKERLVVDEAEQNNSLARYIGGDRLRARRKFADALNEKFGMNVRVENYLRSMADEEQNQADVYGQEEDNATGDNIQ